MSRTKEPNRILSRGILWALSLGALGVALASCGGGGGGPESPFPDDLPTRAEVLARAYATDPLLPGMAIDPYAASTESYGGTSYAVQCLPVTVATESGERLASAAELTDAWELAAGASLPAGFVAQGAWANTTPLFWDLAHRGTDAQAAPAIVRIRVVRRDALDTRKAWGRSQRGRTYREAARRLSTAGEDTMVRGTPAAEYRTADGLATLAQLDWWLAFRGVDRVVLYDLLAAAEEEGPAYRLRYTQVIPGTPDQIQLCEIVYRIDTVTVTLRAGFRLLAQYAGD